jgi:hypothetical protein
VGATESQCGSDCVRLIVSRSGVRDLERCFEVKQSRGHCLVIPRRFASDEAPSRLATFPSSETQLECCVIASRNVALVQLALPKNHTRLCVLCDLLFDPLPEQSKNNAILFRLGAGFEQKVAKDAKGRILHASQKQ